MSAGDILLEIDHLSADHTGCTGGGGEFRDEIASYRRIAVGVGMGQHPEGCGQQTVSGENRRRLVELLVAGRSPAPEVAVVHRRQVVMDQ